MRVIPKVNRKVIFDFDDAIFLNPKDLVSVDSQLEKSTLSMLSFADSIIVSTQYLSDYCDSKGFNSSIITTPVDIFELDEHNNEYFTIGWIGSITNSVHLEELKEPLKILSQKYSIKVLLIGANSNFKIKGVEVVHKKWELEREAEYLTQMDIGIMPLLKNNYSKGKGGYKIFVYMGCGIPVVASPIGINSQIVRIGETGFLAKNTEEWVSSIETLIKDKVLRDRMGKYAKE